MYASLGTAAETLRFQASVVAPSQASPPGLLTQDSCAHTAAGISPTHGLFACAGDDGVLECFDLRQRKAAGYLDAAAAAGAAGEHDSLLKPCHKLPNRVGRLW